MSHLIQLRQRIKAINTIKKITHTMRLIAMSSHSRLRNKEESLREYVHASRTLFGKIKDYAPDWHHPLFYPATASTKPPLIILIGSQRGLCGSFNTTLFHFFERYMAKEENFSASLIAIGKKAVRYSEVHHRTILLRSIDTIHSNILPFIAQDISAFIQNNSEKFGHVIVVSNMLKTFFVQKPDTTVLIPLVQEPHLSKTPTKDGYYWEQSPHELLDNLAYQTMEAHLHYLLFQSLLAEQAARFISMDNATRNVQTMLEATQLQYNKMRQFKITKELTELSFNF